MLIIKLKISSNLDIKRRCFGALCRNIALLTGDSIMKLWNQYHQYLSCYLHIFKYKYCCSCSVSYHFHPHPLSVRLKQILHDERMHFHPYWPGRMPNGQCLLGALLPWTWHSTRWYDANRCQYWSSWWLLQHLFLRNQLRLVLLNNQK